MTTCLEFLLIRHVNKASDDADFVTTMTIDYVPNTRVVLIPIFEDDDNGDHDDDLNASGVLKA